MQVQSPSQVKEYCRDSRKEVDRKLKSVCEAFIANASRQVAGAIMDFQEKVVNHRRGDSSKNISRESWAKPETLQDIIGQSQRNLKKRFPLFQRSMQLYLANKETEFTLFRPIRVRNASESLAATGFLVLLDFIEK